MMKKTIIACLLAFLTLFKPCVADSVTDIVNQVMQKKNIPGMAVAIFDRDKGYILNFGFADLQTRRPVTQDTLFRIASITKVFTTLDLAIQVNRGKMQLQDPLVKYFPRLQKVHGPIHQITLLELATHTASLQRDPPPRANHDSLIRFLGQWRPSQPIGSHYLYSNLSFGLLGLAIAHRENSTYGEAIHRDILAPLSMHSTLIQHPKQFIPRLAIGYKPDNKTAPAVQTMLLPGGGALISSATDMLQFLKANLGIGISPEMQSAVQLTHKDFFKANNKLTLGLGWQKVMVDGNLVLDKNGGLAGFSSYIGFIPDKKIGVVILANKSKIQSTGIGRRLLRELLRSRKTVQPA